MQPIAWLAAVIVITTVSGTIAILRGNTSPTGTVRRPIRAFGDRLNPVTQERGLDRIGDTVSKALAGAINRGVVPGSLNVRLGSVIHLATAASDDDAVISVVQAAVGSLVPPLPDAATLPIEVRKDSDLDPNDVAVAVGPRRRHQGPTPPPVNPSGGHTKAPTKELVRTLVFSLQAITPKLPNFEIAPGRARSIGRLACDIELPEWTGASLFTSRKHAMLTADPEEGFIEVRDQNSPHGIRVNDVPVSSAVLRHGDKLTLGRAEWIVSIAEVTR